VPSLRFSAIDDAETAGFQETTGDRELTPPY